MSPLLERSLLLFGVLCCLQATTALMCYDCNSAYDPNCGDPFDPYTLGKVNCTQQEPLEHLKDKYPKPVLCRKTTQKVYGKVRVVRGCGYIPDERTDDGLCVKRLGTHDVQAIYCACTSELCNHAGSIFYESNNNLILRALPYTLAGIFLWLTTFSSHFNINNFGAVQNS